jgi:hypothetical protein
VDGTVSLIAAMNVTTGEVLTRDIARNDSATFISFLTEIDQAIDPRRIHLIMDRPTNTSTGSLITTSRHQPPPRKLRGAALVDTSSAISVRSSRPPASVGGRTMCSGTTA